MPPVSRYGTLLGYVLADFVVSRFSIIIQLRHDSGQLHAIWSCFLNILTSAKSLCTITFRWQSSQMRNRKSNIGTHKATRSGFLPGTGGQAEWEFNYSIIGTSFIYKHIILNNPLLIIRCCFKPMTFRWLARSWVLHIFKTPIQLSG